MLHLIISFRESGPNSDWPGPFVESLNVFRASSVHLLLSSNFEVQNRIVQPVSSEHCSFRPLWCFVVVGRMIREITNDKGDKLLCELHTMSFIV